MGGPSAWAHFGAGARNWGIHSHFQVWGFIGALLGCIGGVLVIFGLFFRPGILVLLVLAIAHAIGVKHGAASAPRCRRSKCALSSPAFFSSVPGNTASTKHSDGSRLLAHRDRRQFDLPDQRRDLRHFLGLELGPFL